MKPINGVICSKCERQLTYPFSAQVFCADGRELKMNDELYLPSENDYAVVVYLHKKCRLSGHFTNSNTGRNGKMSYTRHKCPARHKESPNAADSLRNMGFAVASKGNRIFMVLPQNVVGK